MVAQQNIIWNNNNLTKLNYLSNIQLGRIYTGFKFYGTFFDNTTWELKTKLWLAYLYGINIICSKKLHEKFIYHKVKRF